MPNQCRTRQNQRQSSAKSASSGTVRKESGGGGHRPEVGGGRLRVGAGDEGLEMTDDRRKDDDRKMGSTFVSFVCFVVTSPRPCSLLPARQWCISHPKDGILLRSYSRPTCVLLPSYWHPTPILPASYSAPTFRNRPKTRENGRKTGNPADDRSLKKKNDGPTHQPTCRRLCAAATGSRTWREKSSLVSCPQSQSYNSAATMSQKIEDYALIGDCHTAALVGRDGSIDWLCVPRFDSPACFAALLGTPEHGRWLLTPGDDVRRVSRRYREGTLVLETDYETDDGAVTVIDFMPPRDEQPVLVRVVQGKRGVVPMRMQLVIRFDYGFDCPLGAEDSWRNQRGGRGRQPAALYRRADCAAKT